MPFCRASGTQENEKFKQSFQCGICLTNDVNRILLPCGHLICDSCIPQLRNRRCPFDRKPFTGVAPFFKPI